MSKKISKKIGAYFLAETRSKVSFGLTAVCGEEYALLRHMTYFRRAPCGLTCMPANFEMYLGCTSVCMCLYSSIEFMHSPITCNAGVPASNSAKAILNQRRDNLWHGVYARNIILALGDRTAARFE